MQQAQAQALEAEGLYRELTLRGRLKRYEAAELAAASVNVFAEHCFGVDQQPLHKRWHQHLEEGLHTLIWCPPEHGKTWQLGFLRMLWLLGKNPQHSYAHMSGTADVPEATLEQVAKHIHSNARVHEVFPHLRVHKFKRTKTGVLSLWLERARETTDRDPSLVAMGILGQVLGRRLDGILLDDILDYDNTYTRAARRKVNQRLEAEVLTRRTAHGWEAYIGHPWFRDDAGHTLAAKPGWRAYRYDAECDVDGRPGPPGLWPEAWADPVTGRVFGWPWARLEDKKANTDTLTWARVWRCRTPSTEQELFPLELLHMARELGAGLPLLRPAPEGAIPVSGMDLSTGDGSDLTVICTVCSQAGRLEVLDLRGGLWDDGRTYKELRDVVRAYPRHGGALIEDNSMQRLVVRTLRRREIMRGYGWTDADMDRCRVRGFTTGKNKHDPNMGVRSMAVDFQQRRVLLPEGRTSDERHQVQQLVDGLNDYDPDQPEKHTSDYVMAFWLAYEMQRRLGGLGARRLGIT